MVSAKKLFNDALAADVNYAAAHNNLGQIYLKQHQLYLAAWEFEFTANLMPGRHEPHVNLGLVYENAGWLEKAVEHYETAYEMDSSNPQTLGSLARVLIKMDGDPVRIHWLLQQLVMHDSRATWVHWAKGLLATKYRPSVETQADAQDPNERTFSTLPPKSNVQPLLAPPTPAAERLPVPVPDQPSIPKENSTPDQDAGPATLMLEAHPIDISDGVYFPDSSPIFLPGSANPTMSTPFPTVPASFESPR